MIRIVLLVFILLTSPVSAQTETGGAQNPAAGQDTGEQDTQDEIQGRTDEETEPQEENLRSRSLGDAFKNFTPSEEISADNAVAFPVDI